VSRLVRRQAQGIVPTGIDRVGLAYLQRFADRSQAVVHQGRFTGYLGQAESQRLFKHLLQPASAPAAARWQGRLHWARFPLWAWRSGSPSPRGLLLHTAHSDLDDEAYVLSWQRHGVRPVVMVHDLIPLTHPAFCRAGEAARHARRMRHTLMVAAGIVVNSQDTLEALRRFAHGQSLPMPPAVVAPLGTRALPEPASLPPGVLPPARPVFLMLGTIEPRKNHLLMLDVWRKLIAQHGETAPRLVIAGRRGWDIEPVTRLLDGDETLWGHVTERGGCTDTELADWMRQARALLQPSWTEGFGMPVAEALQQGLPVIASDLPVFREVAGEVPDYAPPDDAEAWLNLIQAHSQADGAVQLAQRARIAHYTAPTWEAHFAIVEHFMQGLRRHGPH
jgi:glycosyltransferase involved in cell wall biosynthesis